MKKKHEKKACIKIYPGAYSWFLRNIRPIKPPIPIKGKLGVFDLNLSQAEKRILAVATEYSTGTLKI